MNEVRTCATKLQTKKNSGFICFCLYTRRYQPIGNLTRGPGDVVFIPKTVFYTDDFTDTDEHRIRNLTDIVKVTDNDTEITYR